MKLYVVKEGTVGKLITQLPGEKATVTDWTTRKDFDFFTYLVSPFTYGRDTIYTPDPAYDNLARNGYFMFGGDSGGDLGTKYVLAIHERNVQVIC